MIFPYLRSLKHFYFFFDDIFVFRPLLIRKRFYNILPNKDMIQNFIGRDSVPPKIKPGNASATNTNLKKVFNAYKVHEEMRGNMIKSGRKFLYIVH